MKVKTLFARIQGLNQGNTLDDGTTLNKYSSALYKVGVDVKTASGELKDMDTIIDELGPKWKTLADDQKMALAQTVAGVRQYSQFMALMNNYDYFKENVGVAEESTGTLQKQADIYAESWEAASKRVRASAESLYQDLIDDKFFIAINNGIANVLSGLDAFIDKAGGLKTVITGVSGVFLSAFASKIPDAIKTAKYNLQVLTGGSQKAYQNMFSQMQESTNKTFKENNIDSESSLGMQLKQANALSMVKSKYLSMENQLTETEKQRYSIELDILKAQSDELIAKQKQNEETRKGLEKQEEALENKSFTNFNKTNIKNSATHSRKILQDYEGDSSFFGKAFDDSLKQFQSEIPAKVKEMNQAMLKSFKNGTFDKTVKDFSIFGNIDGNSSIGKIFKSLEDISEDIFTSPKPVKNLKAMQVQVKALQDSIDPTIRSVSGLDDAFETLINEKDTNKIIDEVKTLKETLENAKIPASAFEGIIRQLNGDTSIDNLVQKFKELGMSETEAKAQAEIFNQKIKELDIQHTVQLSEAFASLASGIMNAYTAVQSIVSAIKALGDDDLGPWEKFSAILSSIGTLAVVGPQIAQSVATLASLGEKALIAKKGLTAAGAAASGLGTKLLAALAPVLPWIVGIGAAIAAIVLVINKIKANSLEGQIKKSTEAAQELSEQVDKAKSSYEDLLNTIDSYKNVSDKLDDLKTGTIEFTQSLIEANEQAWKLINTLGLTKNNYKIENGRIIIDFNSKEFEDKVKEQQDNQEEIYAAQTNIQQQSNQLNYKKQAKDVFVNTNLGIYRQLLTDDFLQKAFKGTGLSGELDDIIFETVQAEAKQAIGGYEKIFADKLARQMGLLEENQSMYTSYSDYGVVNDKYIQTERQVSSLVAVLRESGDQFKDLYSTYLQAQTSNQNLSLQSLMYSLSNEEAYQNSKYGGQIAAAVAEATKEKIINNLKSEYANKTDEQINLKFETWARNKGYYVENGKIYEDSSKQAEVYDNYTRQDKENALIGIDLINEQTNEVLTEISKFDATMEKITSSDLKAYADALASGGDITKLSEEQIEKIKAAGGIKNVIGDELKDIAEYFGDSWQDFIDQIDNDIKTYRPGDGFDLDSWQQEYEKQLEVYEKISKEGVLKDKYFEQLTPELQQYFQDLQNGTHILTISAEEFYSKIKENSTEELKDSIKATGKEIGKGVYAYSGIVGGERSIDDVNRTAQSMLDNSTSYARDWENNKAVQGLRAATGITDEELAKYDTAEEKVRAIAQAWQDLTGQLETKQAIFGASMNSIDELDQALADGTIDVKAYNTAFDGVIANEVKLNDLDYSSITNYTKYLLENNEALKSSGKSLEEQERIAKKLAVAHAKLNKGVETISKNWSSWNKIIKSGKLDQIQDILPDINKSLAQILDVSEDTINNMSSDFAVKNWDTIKDVIDGVDGSLEKLQVAAAEDLVLQINTNGVTEEMTSLMTELTGMTEGTNLTIEPDIDNANALDGLYELLSAAGVTVDDIMKIFDGLGWQPEIEWTELPAKTAAETNNYGFLEVPQMTGYGSWSTQAIPLKGNDKISGETMVFVPTIKSATKKGGSGSYTPQPPKSSGGGGGKGSTKSSTHPDSKSYSDKERYNTVKNQLEDLNAQYDALDKSKSRAFGKDKLKAMDDEIKKTDSLIDKQKQYIDEIEKYYETDRDVMKKAYDEYIGGPGIEYDENGNISNFDEIQDAMFKKYNDMAARYTEDDDEWKKFEKQFELLQKYIDQYEETHDLLRDEQDKMTDLINQKIDLGLEKVKYTVEISLEVPEDSIKVLDYKLGRLKDNSSDAIESVSLLINKMGQINDKIAVTKNGLADTLKLSMSEAEITKILNGNFEALNELDKDGNKRIKFTEDQVEAIRDYKNSLIDLNNELDEIRENIESKVMVVFDDWQNKLKQGTEVLDHYTSTLESYKNIIDIVGKDTLGIASSFMNDLVQSTVDVAIDKLKSTKTSYEAIVEARDRAQERLNQAQADKDQESIDMWTETLDTINEQVRSSNEEMMQAWEDALNTIADSFEQTVNNLVDTFEKSVYALGGLDGLSDDFSRQQENADLMLDDYQKIYELSKLSRDINKTIDDTNSISGKQKLKKLLEQINDLQADGNEMSKYDLEYLQKTYDLRQAEIELEEAQRAKNTVRLQKDSEGNWSYIYTQSSDAIDSAQQKYEDALYAMQDLSSNYIDEISEKLISTSKEMEEALANIRVQDYANINDYYAQVEKVQNQYQEQLDKQQDELQKALDNNKALYDTDWKNYHEATGYKISDTEDFATKFKDTMLGTLLKSESDNADFTNLIKVSTDSLVTGLNAAAEAYYTNIAKAMEAAGTSTKDFAEEVKKSVDSIKSNSAEATKSVQKMATDMGTAFEQITKSVGAWQETYGIQMQKIRDENTAVVESFNAMLKAMSIDPEEFRISYDFSKIDKNKSSSASSMDTGGYTGNWGPDGRIAVLHQKELVLNEHDTSNMLAAVQMTRSILETIDLNARQAQIGLGAMVAGKLPEEQKEALQQEVHITAEFPNVNDHNEIEEAFNNLINQASQYANRK